MRRRSIRPYGAAAPNTKLWSMVFALALLWMLYDRMKDPLTWRWFSPHDELAAAQVTPEAKPAGDAPQEKASAKVVEAPAEEVVPGPNDLNEEEQQEARAGFESVVDKAVMLKRDMESYWRLMKWARTETTAQFEKRAARDVPFTQIFERPESYRGKLIHLRMHVRRVLVHDDIENDIGLKKVYEIWGWTDESKSFPYVVIVPELPKGLPVGTDIRSEVIFTGYFLKVMAYRAFEASRGAPLLIGRVRMAAPRPVPTTSKVDPMTTLPIVALVGIALVITAFAARRKSLRKTTIATLPEELPGVQVPGDLIADAELNSQPFEVMQSPVVEPARAASVSAGQEPPLTEAAVAVADVPANADAKIANAPSPPVGPVSQG